MIRLMQRFAMLSPLMLAIGAGPLMAFDSEAFRENRRPAWCPDKVLGFECQEPRAGMWDALRTVLKPGMTQEEVRVLPGPADQVSDPVAGQVAGQGTEQYWTYEMGLQWIDTLFLVLVFDADGRLLEIRETQG
ncbi:hypothetical protein [Pseudogemmobacter bohemicus]|uniref:hypothetical protein n=1 Tax=Pseudogemmobacter bohemicus TaxID=2250708 RepID=UPI001300BC6D|nr:hypothetical protein [Pseudogemmobacter bohemicus]